MSLRWNGVRVCIKLNEEVMITGDGKNYHKSGSHILTPFRNQSIRIDNPYLEGDNTAGDLFRSVIHLLKIKQFRKCEIL